jgi:hypothetical protein
LAKARALKARFNKICGVARHVRSSFESRFQRSTERVLSTAGVQPQAKIEIAPLALPLNQTVNSYVAQAS